MEIWWGHVTWEKRKAMSDGEHSPLPLTGYFPLKMTPGNSQLDSEEFKGLSERHLFPNCSERDDMRDSQTVAGDQ